jgi:GTPase
MVSKENTILSREFKADIYIFHHSTTILPKKECRSGYQPVIHCNGIRQSAEILSIENKNNILRSNQRSIVHFRFRYHDEYIVKNSKFIFREGNTRGIGKIIEVM